MILLRPVGVADLQRLFELDQICFPAGVAYSLRDFRRLLRSSRVFGFVAEEETVLAGFAMAQVGMQEGQLTASIITIDTAPDFRRRGLGRLIMEAIESEARSRQAVRLSLEVAVDNAAAQSFYLGRGFTGIGEIPNYYANNADALVMEKPLTAGAISSDDT